jgi:hypothetical protein
MEAGTTPPVRNEPMTTTAEPELSGWAIFVGVALLVIGSLDALWGLAGILNDEIVVVGGRGALIVDLTTWGWVHLILGSIMALTGLGVLVENAAARVVAIFFVAVNAVAQIVWFPAAPLWAFLMIILDITIIYQLTVRWEDAY